MSNWFNPDNKFMTTMSKVFDTIVLNTIWLLICVPLPILTIVWVGNTENMWLLFVTAITLLPAVPATTAMYYSAVKSIRRERSYAITEFFRSFIRNFRQGIIFSVIAIVVAAVLIIDFDYAWNMMQAGQNGGSTYLGFFIVIFVLFTATYAYLCPLLSRFEMKTGALLKMSFVLATRHVLTTITLLVLGAAMLLFCYLLPPVMFFLPATVTIIASLAIEKVFKKYMPAKEELPADENEEVHAEKDEWYLE